MTQESDKISQELINRIIEAEKDLFGEVAVLYARKVKGIEISGEGRVLKLSESPESIVIGLVLIYEELGGRLGRHLSESVIAAYRKNYPTLTLSEGK
jgi:hypothetical protein